MDAGFSLANRVSEKFKTAPDSSRLYMENTDPGQHNLNSRIKNVIYKNSSRPNTNLKFLAQKQLHKVIRCRVRLPDSFNSYNTKKISCFKQQNLVEQAAVNALHCFTFVHVHMP